MTGEQRKAILNEALTYGETTKVFICEAGALEKIPFFWNRQFPGASAVITADENTWDAAGRRIAALLDASGIPMAEPYIFPGEPMLDSDVLHAHALRNYYSALPGAVPLAVGSGTINDQVKYASFLLKRPYAVAATAASVDGYAANGAPLLVRGAKVTLPCPAPEIIIGDTDILSRSPAVLSSAGYGDLASKIPAGTDWILADFTGEEKLNHIGWDLVQGHLHDWLKDPADTEGIFIGLTLCGIAMQHMVSSRPVSGGEHLLSHVWEMHHHTHDGKPVLHGLKVAVGTLITMAATWWLLEHGPKGGTPAPWKEKVRRKQDLLAREFGFLEGFKDMEDILLQKYRSEELARTRRDLIIEKWDILNPAMKARLIPYTQLRDTFCSAGCPVRPEEIGISRSSALETIRTAQLLRDRYMILDALDDLGLLEECIKDLTDDPQILR